MKKDDQPSGHTFLNPASILKQVGLKSGQWVADLGCGGGYFVLPASKIIGDSGQVYGVDVLKTALSSVSSRARLYGLSNIRLVWANVEIFGASRGIQDKSLDMVLMVQLLSQSKKRRDIFKEADRIIKSGGTLVVIDWNSDKLSFSPQKKVHIDPQEIKGLAKEMYFTFERELEVSSYHYCLIFKK